VERSVADAAIAHVFEEEQVNEAASIERVARKKLKTLAKLDAVTQRRRLYAFLARRGYDSDAIGGALRELVAESESDV
jgi:regulatory protein